MKQIRDLISVVLILSLLLGAMPVSALAETLQELAIEETMQDGVPANAEGDLPDETTGDEAPMQEILLLEEETAAPQLSLNDLPQMMEDIQAAISETVPEEEDILEETIETETESTPMDMVLAPLLIEEAQPISLESVEYIIGEESADLALNLPAEALPVTEIEGLVCDADYFHAEGVLTLTSAWLLAQDAEEITLTIHGADGNTYLQPIRFVHKDASENEEHDPINLLIDGAVVAGNSGEGWEYDYAANTLYLSDFSAETIVLMDEMEAFTLHLTGENHVQGIYLGGVKQAVIAGSGSLNITDCHYAIETGSLEIGADVTLNVKSQSVAFRLSGACILNGQEIDVDGCNEIRIESGELLHAEDVQGLAIGETFLSTEQLQNDASGSGWQWIAAEQKLLLNDFSGETIVSTLNTVNIYAGESMDKLTINACDLVLSGKEGEWITDVQLEAVNLELMNSSWILAGGEEAGFALESLIVSGGSLRTDADVVVETLTISGGKLEAGTLTANDLKITGGSLNVTDSTLAYEDETGKTYYGLVAVNAEMSGGSLLTAEPAFVGTYKQTGGTAEFATNARNFDAKHLVAVGASDIFTATGGTLIANNAYGAAIFATEIKLGGKLTADIYGEGGVLLAEKITVAGKKITSLDNTTLVMSKGKTQTLKREKYYGLVIGDVGYTYYMVKNKDFSGEGWDWDHKTKTLTLRGLQGTSSKSKEIYFDNGAVNLHLQDGYSNRYLGVVSLGAITVTGNGSIHNVSISCEKAIKIKNSENLGYVFFRSNSSLSLNGVQGSDLRYEIVGDVNISNSLVTLLQNECGKNLTIKNSQVRFRTTDHMEYCGYVYGKATINNSIIQWYDELYARKGTSIASNAAVFRYLYSDLSRLIKNATLSQDWVLEWTGYAIPQGKTLTIADGKTLYLKSADDFQVTGEVKGNVAVLGDAESVHISGQNQISIGGSIQLTASVKPNQTRNGIRWSTSDLGLCEVDASGRVTATKNASCAGERVIITAEYEGNDQIFATHEILLIPAAEEIAARDASGRYAKNLELWLDPANNSTQLTAKIYPYHAQQNVTWKSSDSKIVSVDENGVITAKKAGSANVYAVAADGSGVKSQNVKVTVKKAPGSIKFSTTKPVLGYDPENGAGSTYQLKVKLSSGSASTVKYTSANEGIAVVDANGIVTAKGAGKVKITAQTYNGKKASCTVQVKTAPQSITISPKQLTIGVGMKHSFTASIPKNSFGSWYFSTSNACGGIDAATGEFTALKPGEVDVIVTTFNGRSDACTVQVLPAPEELKLNRPQLKMGLNEKFTLQVEASLKDGSPAMGSYTYASSDKKVATVSSTGKITAKKRGTAIIIVTANGGATAQCEVIIEKAPSKVSLKAKKATFVYDEATQTGTDFLNPASLPAGTSSALTYKSSNQKVAVVDGEGRITAKGVGTAKITVKTFNGKSATCTVTVKAAPKELKFDQEIYTISVGQELYAKITNASGLDLTRYGGIISLDPKAEILTVDAQGASFAGREVGSAQLKAAAFNAAEGYAEVRVLPPPDALTLEKTTLTLKKGKKYTVKAQLSREDGQETTAGLSLVSGNSKIAGVSGMTITAKAKGKTVITVQTHNGLSQEIQLNVN